MGELWVANPNTSEDLGEREKDERSTPISLLILLLHFPSSLTSNVVPSKVCNLKDPD